MGRWLPAECAAKPPTREASSAVAAGLNCPVAARPCRMRRPPSCRRCRAAGRGPAARASAWRIGTDAGFGGHGNRRRADDLRPTRRRRAAHHPAPTALPAGGRLFTAALGSTDGLSATALLRSPAPFGRTVRRAADAATAARPSAAGAPAVTQLAESWRHPRHPDRRRPGPGAGCLRAGDLAAEQRQFQERCGPARGPDQHQRRQFRCPHDLGAAFQRQCQADPDADQCQIESGANRCAQAARRPGRSEWDRPLWHPDGPGSDRFLQVHQPGHRHLAGRLQHPSVLGGRSRQA